MNYPVWFLPDIGGGLLIALIAIVHVFISHFAVGGGLYLVAAETWAARRGDDPQMLSFTKRHAKFFLLVTMVFGGVTGVGIWFIIGLVQPDATSALIHTFVFGWAAEWVWFLVEIVALLVYFYTFDQMPRRTHMTVGWIYFGAAWLSLFLINGIIGFMLTPGAWPETHNFWHGFFNPSFWPSLFFRSFISFMLAGVYAFITTAGLKAGPFKSRMVRFSGGITLVSALLAVPFGIWYLQVLPEPARELIQGGSPTIAMARQHGMIAMAVLLLATLVLTLWKPSWNRRSTALVVLVAAFVALGAFEWTREADRRPYVINEVMYSNGLRPQQVEAFNKQGFLANAKWSQVQQVDDSNLQQAGAELFRYQCYICHTVDGINNPIKPKVAHMDFASMQNYLDRIHQIRYFMPPFAGTEKEKQALAAYLVGTLHGKPLTMPAAASDTSSAAPSGQQLFANNCAFCHGEDKVKRYIQGWDRQRIRTALDKLNELNSAMPPYEGSAAEKEDLTDYLMQAREKGES